MEITDFETRHIIKSRVIAKMGDIYPAYQDVENEAMFRYVKAVSKGKFRGKADIRMYIISITDCAIADYFRKAYKENPEKLSFLWDLIDDPLAAIEVKEIIEESFKVLSDDQRKAIVYTEIYGMSQKKAAELMIVSQGYINTLKMVAKKKMKTKLKKMGFMIGGELRAQEKIEWLGKFYRAYESMCKKSDYGNDTIDAMLHDARQAYEGIKERLEERVKWQYR